MPNPCIFQGMAQKPLQRRNGFPFRHRVAVVSTRKSGGWFRKNHRRAGGLLCFL